jgi:hypothetical protein
VRHQQAPPSEAHVREESARSARPPAECLGFDCTATFASRMQVPKRASPLAATWNAEKQPSIIRCNLIGPASRLARTEQCWFGGLFQEGWAAWRDIVVSRSCASANPPSTRFLPMEPVQPVTSIRTVGLVLVGMIASSRKPATTRTIRRTAPEGSSLQTALDRRFFIPHQRAHLLVCSLGPGCRYIRGVLSFAERRVPVER